MSRSGFIDKAGKRQPRKHMPTEFRIRVTTEPDIYPATGPGSRLRQLALFINKLPLPETP